MSTIGATGTTPDTQNTSSTQLAKQKLSETYDNFLTLLTTQLQYQDPLQPMDSAQFTSQLVQYSQVEQQIAQNEKLEQMLAMENASLARASLGFIGLDVQMAVKEFDYTEGSMTFEYTMPEKVADGAMIRIINSDGKTVAVAEAKTDFGEHEFVWNGKNKEGENVKPGTYTVDVVARDTNDQTLKIPTTTYGKVTGIEAEKGETYLLIGNSRVPVDQVRTARQVGAAA